MRFATTTAILLATWWVLSGKADALHLGTGVATSLAIAALVERRRRGPIRPVRLLLYAGWLAGKIAVSNLRVARLVLSPRLAIRPSFLRLPPGVQGEGALATLAGSITLTPGTLSIDVGPGEILVHALDAASERDVREGQIARRVLRVFEPPSRP